MFWTISPLTLQKRRKKNRFFVFERHKNAAKHSVFNVFGLKYLTWNNNNSNNNNNNNNKRRKEREKKQQNKSRESAKERQVEEKERKRKTEKETKNERKRGLCRRRPLQQDAHCTCQIKQTRLRMTLVRADPAAERRE